MEGNDGASEDDSSTGQYAIIAGGGALVAALWLSSKGSSFHLRASAVVGASAATVALVLAAAAAARRRAVARAEDKALVFVPWKELDALEQEKILVLDTTHPTRECLTHHKMKYAPPPSLRGDTTTAMVLKAVCQRHPLLMRFTGVSVDHFDIDAFLSIYSACHPHFARSFAAILREAAHIGDFRELDLSRPGAASGLKVCCWLNTLERKMFTRPFEGGDEHKWPYFLGGNTFSEFVQALSTSPSAGCDVWGSEYDRVMEDLEILSSQGQVQRFEDIRLCVVTAPRPLHYYALFSVTKGCDTGINFSLTSFTNLILVTITPSSAGPRV
jgi:hypothetical protein